MVGLFLYWFGWCIGFGYVVVGGVDFVDVGGLGVV